MFRIEWVSLFEVGIPELDADHRRIVATVNGIAQAMEHNDRDACKKLTRTFLDMVEEHFAREEQILASFGYHEVDEHAARHREMSDLLSGIRAACEDMDNPADGGKILEEIMSYVITDIVQADLAFKSHLQELGAGVPRQLFGLR